MDGLKSAFQVVNKMVEDGVIRKYAVAGAVAALNYIEPTSTTDLDILVSFDVLQGETGIVTLGPILAYLSGRGYTEFEKEGILIEGWPVQFLPVANDLDAEGLEQAVEIEIEPATGLPPIKIMVLRAEHLVATALKIGRPKDRERIISFLSEKKVDLKALRDVLERHNLRGEWSKLCTEVGVPDFD